MSEIPHKKNVPDPFRDKTKSRGANSEDLDDMKSVSDIPDHCLKASTTMHGVITDPDQAERIRELIKKLK